MPKVSSLLGSWQSHRALFLVTLLLLAADQLSKWWIRENLLLEQSLPKEGAWRLTHIANYGITFGLSAPKTLSLVLPPLIIVAALFFYFRYTPFNSRLSKIALGLLVGGGLGNLVDRLRLGYVTDFIDVRLWDDFHWPAFNLADLAIVIGAILLVYFLQKDLRKSPQNS